MAADFNKPVVGDNYSTLLQGVRDVFAALALGLDPANVTPSNTPTNAVRWNSAASKWQKFNGSTWGDLASAYAISISGSAASLSATLPVDKGGTNLTSYTVGDLIYASGTTTLAKLAAVATGNVLISGGPGAAFSWGKVGLTTHVSGTLAIANGGTGATTSAAARTALGLGTAATKTAGTGAGHVLELSEDSKLPALDGSLLTGIVSIPAGAIMAFGRSTPPSGWLECNGQAISRSTYATLFAAIGTAYGVGNGSSTFNVPDLRAEFVRGWDNGRGVDSGRALGSAQGDDNKSHTHTGSAASAGSHTHSATGFASDDLAAGNGFRTTTIGNTPYDRSTNSSGAHTHSLSIDAAGGSESRPRNVSAMYCIKT